MLDDFLKLARLAGRDVEGLLLRFRGGQRELSEPLATRAGLAAWLTGLAELRSAWSSPAGRSQP